MTNFNDAPELDNLNAGRDFADYLTANGWNIIDVFATGKHANQSLKFEKDNVIIEYIITDKESSFKSSVKVPQLKGWHSQNYVTGPDLEGDITKFAFLCDALGWVNLATAVKNFRTEFEPVKQAA